MKTRATQKTLWSGPARAVIAILLAAGLAGCSGNFSSRTDVNINGHRKVTQVTNGVKRTFETRDAVVFQDGEIVEFPKGAVVRLSEQQGQQTKTAELREHNGKPELWMEVGGAFRTGTDVDKAWLKDFLKALNIGGGKKQQPKKELVANQRCSKLDG